MLKASLAIGPPLELSRYLELRSHVLTLDDISHEHPNAT